METATNPILDEINGLSLGAKAALVQFHQGQQQAQGAQQAAAQPAPAFPRMEAPTTLPAMPSAPSPSVPAPRGTLAGDENERGRLLATGPGESQIYQKVTQSRFGKAHPLPAKILGGLGQGLATAADVAGSMFGPTAIAERSIPGTMYHHALQVRNINNEIADEAKEQQAQATAGAERARADLENTQAAELPGSTQAKEDLTYAQIQRLLNPEATNAFEAWHQQNPNGDVMDFLRDQANIQANAKPSGTKTIQREIDGKQHTILVDERTGRDIRDEGVTGTKPAVVNTEHEGVNYVVPDGKGGQKIVRLMPGESVPEGAQTTTSFGTVPSMTKQRGSMAEAALEQSNELVPMIEQLKDQLGPAAGRWNELWVKGAGLNNPAFAELDQRLQLYASAVVVAHFGARGGGMQFIDKMMNDFREAQSPENLVARIKGANTVLKKYADQAGVKIPFPDGNSAGTSGGTAAPWTKYPKGGK